MTNPGTYKDLTIVILAGGRSTRMGADKGLLEYKKSYFVKEVLDLANSLTPNVIVSVGEHNQGFYATQNIPFILDTVLDKGPVGGIASVLPHIKTNWFFVVSVDTPLVDERTIAELWNNKKGFEAVVFSSDNRIHPLVGLYHLLTKSKWLNAFDNDELKVSKLVEQFNLNKIVPNQEITDRLKNINTPEEYQELIK